MKRFTCICAIALLGISLQALALGASNLPSQLSTAFENYRTVRLQAFNDARLDDLKMHLSDRAQCVGMGTRECARMMELHAVQGADHSGDTPTGNALQQARDAAKTAYQAEIAGKGKDHIEAAKKLYAAWLTEMDTFATYSGDPLDFDQTPAAIAYTQAANEYKIDTGG